MSSFTLRQLAARSEIQLFTVQMLLTACTTASALAGLLAGAG